MLQLLMAPQPAQVDYRATPKDELVHIVNTQLNLLNATDSNGAFATLKDIHGYVVERIGREAADESTAFWLAKIKQQWKDHNLNFVDACMQGQALAATILQ